MSMPDFLLPRPALSSAQPHPFPCYASRQLANGLTVWTFQLPGQHLIAAELVMMTPLAAEPAAIEGVTSLIMDTITDGTVSSPGSQFAAALDDQGAALDGRVTHSASMLGLRVPVTRFDRGLALLAQATQEAQLADEDVERNIDIRRSEIAQELINPTHAVERAFKLALFNASDRQSRPSGGKLSNLDALSGELVRAQYAKLWRPDQATLIVAGDLPSDVDATIDEHFRHWTPGHSQFVTCEPALNCARQILIVDRPDAPQAQLRIGGPGIDRRNPRWSTSQLATQAIGGGFLSRINRVLREERGYTYGAHVSLSPLSHGGSFALRGSFRTEVAVDAIQTALQLLDVRSYPIPADEVLDAKNYLLGVGPLQRQTADQIVGQAAALASVGMTPHWIDENQRAIAEADVADTNAALAELIDPEHCHIVIAADAAAIVDPMTEAGLAPQVITLAG